MKTKTMLITIGLMVAANVITQVVVNKEPVKSMIAKVA